VPTYHVDEELATGSKVNLAVVKPSRSSLTTACAAVSTTVGDIAVPVK